MRFLNIRAAIGLYVVIEEIDEGLGSHQAFMLMINPTVLKFHQRGDIYYVVVMYLSFSNSFSKHVSGT